MAIYKVDTPDGKVIQVSAPDDATDEQIIELAKTQEAATRGPVEPENDLTQARILGTGAGIVNAVGTSVPGAIAGSVRTMRDIGQAQPPQMLSQKYPGLQGTDIDVNQSAIQSKKIELAEQNKLLNQTQDPSARRLIQDNINRLTTDIGDARSGIRMERGEAMSRLRQAPMSQIPARAEELAATYSPRGAAAASNLGKFAAKAVGPYGAITSAADASQRFQNARGPLDYLQSGISGVGAAGYGMSSLGNIFPPAKVPGMMVGGAADLANMGIDAVNEYVRRLALQRAQQQ